MIEGNPTSTGLEVFPPELPPSPTILPSVPKVEDGAFSQNNLQSQIRPRVEIHDPAVDMPRASGDSSRNTSPFISSAVPSPTTSHLHAGRDDHQHADEELSQVFGMTELNEQRSPSVSADKGKSRDLQPESPRPDPPQHEDDDGFPDVEMSQLVDIVPDSQAGPSVKPEVEPIVVPPHFKSHEFVFDDQQEAFTPSPAAPSSAQPATRHDDDRLTPSPPSQQLSHDPPTSPEAPKPKAKKQKTVAQPQVAKAVPKKKAPAAKKPPKSRGVAPARPASEAPSVGSTGTRRSSRNISVPSAVLTNEEDMDEDGFVEER